MSFENAHLQNILPVNAFLKFSKNEFCNLLKKPFQNDESNTIISKPVLG